MVVAIASMALVVALVALGLVRRQGRTLAQLTEMYWQLKYEHGELKARVAPTSDEPSPPPSTFVPLGAVKRSSTTTSVLDARPRSKRQ